LAAAGGGVNADATAAVAALAEAAAAAVAGDELLPDRARRMYMSAELRRAAIIPTKLVTE
jgi:hypothetical protein